MQQDRAPISKDSAPADNTAPQHDGVQAGDLAASNFPALVQLGDRRGGSPELLQQNLQALADRIPALSVDPQGFRAGLNFAIADKGVGDIARTLMNSATYGQVLGEERNTALPLNDQVTLAGGLYVIAQIAAKDPVLAEKLIMHGWKMSADNMRIAEQLEKTFVEDMRFAMLTNHVMRNQHATETDRAFMRGALAHYFVLDEQQHAPGFWRNLRDKAGLMYEDQCGLKGAALIRRESEFLDLLAMRGKYYRLEVPVAAENLSPKLREAYNVYGKDKISLMNAVDAALNTCAELTSNDFQFLVSEFAAVDVADSASGVAVRSSVNKINGQAWSGDDAPHSQSRSLALLFKALNRVGEIADLAVWDNTNKILRDAVWQNPGNSASGQFRSAVNQALNTLQHQRVLASHPEIGHSERMQALAKKWFLTEKRVGEIFDIVCALPRINEREFNLLADRVLHSGALTMRAAGTITDVIEGTIGKDEGISDLIPSREGAAAVLVALSKLDSVKDPVGFSTRISAIKAAITKYSRLKLRAALNKTIDTLGKRVLGV